MAIRATPNNFARRQRRPLRKDPTQLMLEIVRGRAKQRLRKVRAPVFLIGSASDCDLVLGDDQFPDAYAYIFQRSDGVSVRYLGTGPALEVDGLPRENAQLVIGSRITAGPFEFVLTNQHGDRGDDEEEDEVPIFKLSREAQSYDPDGIDAVYALLREVRRQLVKEEVQRGSQRTGISRQAS